MSRKKSPIAAEDAALFRSQVAGATPLQSDRVVPANHSVSPRRPPSHPDPQLLKDAQGLHFNSERDANELLFFTRGGLQQKALKRLKRGEVPIEGRLDLHGCTLAEAQKHLQSFVLNSQTQAKRCVLIIHGRGTRSEQGRPVLKQAVDQWLPQLPAVLAYASAQPEHGGLGAVYVILKKVI